MIEYTKLVGPYSIFKIREVKVSFDSKVFVSEKESLCCVLVCKLRAGGRDRSFRSLAELGIFILTFSKRMRRRRAEDDDDEPSIQKGGRQGTDSIINSLSPLASSQRRGKKQRREEGEEKSRSDYLDSGYLPIAGEPYFNFGTQCLCWFAIVYAILEISNDLKVTTLPGYCLFLSSFLPPHHLKIAKQEKTHPQSL